MKKIVQLALLMSLTNITTSYCWEWSDLVPTKLSTWYENYQLKKIYEKDYIEPILNIEKEYVEDHPRGGLIEEVPKHLANQLKKLGIGEVHGHINGHYYVGHDEAAWSDYEIEQRRKIRESFEEKHPDLDFETVQEIAHEMDEKITNAHPLNKLSRWRKDRQKTSEN